MPMKVSGRAVRAVVAAGFVSFGAFGQDSVQGLTPMDSTQASSELSANPGKSATPADSARETSPFPPSIYANIKSKGGAAKADSTRKNPPVPADPNPKATPAGSTAAQRTAVPDSSSRNHAPAASHEPAAGAEAAPLKSVAKDEEKDKVLELESDVVVGYGTMKKEDLTGSVISVKADDLARDAVFSIRKALQGRAAGVNVVQNSGAPGKGMTVRIRGVGTINNSDPLYVVDGAPVSGIDYLNPDDIESMSILKDASATAIYGSRGANGVVMVSTKKAKDGISRVNYSMYIGMQNPWKKPSLCNAGEWAMLNNEALRAANQPVFPQIENPSALGAGTDWFDLITNKNALIQQHNVSIVRGTDKLKYYISAGYFDQEGIIKGSELQKKMFRVNTENKIAPWISFGNNFGITHFLTNYTNESDEWNGVLVNALAIDPVTKPRDEKGNLIPSVFNNAKNPMGIIENTNVTGKKTAISGTVFSTITIADFLKVKSTFGLDLTFNDSTEFLPKYFISSSDRNDNAKLTRKTSTDNMWVLENTVSYERIFAENYSVKLLAGVTAQDKGWDSVFSQNQTTSGNDSTKWVLDATKGLNPVVKGLTGSSALASAFGRLEYDYCNKYLLTATFRRDGSSRFGIDNRWGNFPSFAGAWKVSQEPFMREVPFIEGLKLRAGWGKTGNQEIPDYLFSTTTTGNQNYPFGTAINPGTTYLSAGNSKIHWEEQTAANGGFDVNALGGKIELMGDAFVKRTNDMLIRKSIPAMAGLQTPPMINLGSIENKGVELVLNYKETIGGFLTALGLNFSTYANKVVSLGDTSSIVDANFRNAGFVTRTQVGHPVGCFYGYKTNGLFQSREEIRAFTYKDKDGKTQLVQPNAAPGDIRYRDDNGDGVPDQGYIGSPHPDFIMGMSVDVGYGGFDVSALFQGVYGNQIFDGSRWYMENGTAFFNLNTRMLDRWTGTGTTNDVGHPRLNQKDANQNLSISDRFIEDGSYVRLKTLQVGYTLSPSLCGKLLIKNCRVYLGAENLFTLTGYKGLDPEIGTVGTRTGITNSGLTMGVDYVTYPQARTFLVGLNITL